MSWCRNLGFDMRVLIFNFLTGLQVITWSQAYASASIEVPAGVMPSSDSTVHSAVEVPLERSKSKVLPLPGFRTIASRDLYENKRSLKIREKMGRPDTALDGDHRLKLAEAKPAAQETGTKTEQPPSSGPSATSKIPSDEVVKKSGHSDSVASESVASDSNSENPWDNAATSLDQEEAKVLQGSGFRLEDVVGPQSHYNYSAVKRHNPFVPSIVTRNQRRAVELGSNDVEIPILSPLQVFSLSQLVVIGVWASESKGWRAIIQTPSSQGIEVGLGDPAGNSGGRVMAISEESVLVREFKVRADGGREYKDVLLSIGVSAADNSEEVVGGRVILRPGASSPEIDRFDGKKLQANEPPVSVNRNGQNGPNAERLVLHSGSGGVNPENASLEKASLEKASLEKSNLEKASLEKVKREDGSGAIPSTSSPQGEMDH